MKPVRIGCSGWTYDSWRGRLYPEREPKRRWLELYAEQFDIAEGKHEHHVGAGSAVGSN